MRVKIVLDLEVIDEFESSTIPSKGGVYVHKDQQWIVGEIFPGEKEALVILSQPLKSCPLCNNKVIVHDVVSDDGTITWIRVMHAPEVDCGISFIGRDENALIQWNKKSRH